MVETYTNGPDMSDDIVSEAASFLHQHLDRFGDPKEQILACLAYAKDPQRGGRLYLIREGEKIVAASVVLKTHMLGFIPPHILVYIAVDAAQRGKGLGKKLITHIQEDINEDIALHVEPDNPAKRLYERLNFTNKYLEMRWKSDGSP